MERYITCEEVCDLFEQGLTAAETAARLGLDVGSVSSFYNDLHEARLEYDFELGTINS
jgi:DNA-directed RNA polymerase specialized sigma24 family protein